MVSGFTVMDKNLIPIFLAFIYAYTYEYPRFYCIEVTIFKQSFNAMYVVLPHFTDAVAF